MKKREKKKTFILLSMVIQTASVVGNKKYVEDGETVQLTCPLNGNHVGWSGPPNFTVYSVGQMAFYPQFEILSNKSTNKTILQINNFTSENEGWYRCDNETTDFDVKVLVKKNPTNMVIENETEQGVIYGIEFENLTLKCSVHSGEPQENMAWFHDNTILEEGGPGNVSYQINATMSDHKANYSCKALDQNAGVLLKKTVQLYIFCQPKINIPSFLNTTEGHNFILNCSFESNDPHTKVTWFGGDDNRFKNPLSFQPISRKQTGNYTCIVESRGGTKNRIIQIVVQYPPDVYITRSLGVEGQHVLHCHANGVPEGYIFYPWEHTTILGEHIRFLNGSVNGTLTIPGQSENSYYKESGIYICNVSNGIQRTIEDVNSTKFKLQIPGKPLFMKKTDKRQFAIYGKNATIHAYVYSYPKCDQFNVYDKKGKI